MRVLANQFVDSARTLIQKDLRLPEEPHISIQTGARAEDRQLEGDLIFTTIDQALSSFLTIPYSLGGGRANINAGAVIGSYLVLDEFHLFPVNGQGLGALTTTLQMLRMLRGVTPFVLMTATFSETMITRLATLLDAEPLIVKDHWLADIPSQHGKERTFTRRDEPLSAQAVWEDFMQHDRRRAIAICNTVERAQALGSALIQAAEGSDVHVEVLHSRFFRGDGEMNGARLRGRDSKEDDIRREFGEDHTAHTWPRAILIATQVVEVGLNITCEALHTETAPAASLVQRAGRCARFEQERGEVFVYDVPRDEGGAPQYAPYSDEGQAELCAKTWQALEGWERRLLDYAGELALVEEVHRDYDTRLLDQLDAHEYALRERIGDAWRAGDRTAGRELIRDIDSRTVVIHPDPSNATMPRPYEWEGISVPRNRLLRWWREAQEAGAELDWMAQYPYEPQRVDDAESEGPKRPVYLWQKLRQGQVASDLLPTDLLVINPALIRYDAQLGLCFDQGDADFQQPEPSTAKRGGGGDPFFYTKETYKEHIEGLHRVYRARLRPYTAAAQKRLADRLALSGGAEQLDRAIRLMFATHDLGKLDRRWQAWAHNWQRRVSELRKDPSCVIGADYMAAHTDSAGRAERKESEKTLPKRPHHAAESARAAAGLLHVISGGSQPLRKALLTAIVRHHAAQSSGDHDALDTANGSGSNHYAAKRAFIEALEVVGLTGAPELAGVKGEWQFGRGSIARDLCEPQRTDEMLLYLLLARILRLCDQGSLEASA